MKCIPCVAIDTQPAEFCRSNFKCGYGTDNAQDIKFAKGTTTLAFKVSDRIAATYTAVQQSCWRIASMATVQSDSALQQAKFVIFSIVRGRNRYF
jgi:hypothetical protein